jgi:NitT/TauT family transport system substrate-binding protein
MPTELAENFRAVFYAPFYATPTLGFFAREGVDVALIDSAHRATAYRPFSTAPR